MSVPAALRLQLGGLIRQARTQRGLTQDDLARHLDCTQGKIQKIEAGENAVKLIDLAKIIVVLEVDGAIANKMTTLAEQSGLSEPWSGPRRLVPKWFRKYQDLEAAASAILGWRGERMPGLLQSQHFMLRLFATAESTDLTDYFRNRRARTKILDRPNPPDCQFILSEAVFRRMPYGLGPGVALDQVQHLLKLVEAHAQLGIRVLPFTAPIAYLPGDYTILRFPDDTDDVAFVEHLVDADYRKKPEEVADFARSWDELSAAALDHQATHTFLRELVTDLRKQVTF